jgi:hypothetical protein
MKDANAKASKVAIVPLDRSRLLGFDQAGSAVSVARGARLASLGARVGAKPGLKPKP